MFTVFHQHERASWRRTGRSRAWRALVPIAMLLVAAAGAASADPLPTSLAGGDGGTPFHVLCPAGNVLIGIRAKAGSWLDRVGPVCASWNPETRTRGPYRDMTTEFGGAGGQWTRFGCPPDSAIAGMQVQVTRGKTPLVVGNIDGQQCRSLVPPYKEVTTQARQIGGAQRLAGLPDRLQCASGQVAVGLTGASGSYVDRIGLVCDAPPARTRPTRR